MFCKSALSLRPAALLIFEQEHRGPPLQKAKVGWGLQRGASKFVYILGRLHFVL